MTCLILALGLDVLLAASSSCPCISSINSLGGAEDGSLAVVVEGLTYDYGAGYGIGWAVFGLNLYCELAELAAELGGSWSRVLPLQGWGCVGQGFAEADLHRSLGLARNASYPRTCRSRHSR